MPLDRVHVKGDETGAATSMLGAYFANMAYLQDETRHASLSWEIARWADTRLDAAARRRIENARRHAVTALAGELKDKPPVHLAQIAGVPDAERAAVLLATLDRQLWAA